MTRAGSWLDALGAALLGVALSSLLLAVVSVPQRRAQRSATAGVLALHLLADGGLRLWNHRLGEAQLAELLGTAARRPGPRPRLRLIPDPSLPWGVVRDRIERLEAAGLPLELHLP
ncbi:MAG: hypothetical protein ACK55X_01980 [Synechococcaceae cyanobacterium]|jgi:hypothetical protein